MKFDYDIIIVGGGLCGGSLGVALHSLPGVRFAVLDSVDFMKKHPHPPTPSPIASRALALSHSSIEFFKGLHFWEKMEDFVEPIYEVQVSKEGRFGLTTLSASDAGLSELGGVIEADYLNYLLNAFLHSHAGSLIKAPTEIKRLEYGEDGWTISLNTGETLKTALLVAADGTHSFVRQSLGIDATVKQYHETAIVCNIALEKPHQGRAFERFLDTGSLACLPLKGNFVKCVWVLKTSDSDHIKTLSDSAFLEVIKTKMGGRLAFSDSIGERLYFPLQSVRAETLYSDRSLLIGNAANTLHPVAAQGFNLGLRDIATLVRLVSQAKEQHQDIGGLALLKHYAELRKPDQDATFRFSDTLIEYNACLSLGILGCEFFPPLKHQVMKQGLGLR